MVVYPVVPKGVILLRLIPTAAHTIADVERTISAFEAIKDKLMAGGYATKELADMAGEFFSLKIKKKRQKFVKYAFLRKFELFLLLCSNREVEKLNNFKKTKRIKEDEQI